MLALFATVNAYSKRNISNKICNKSWTQFIIISISKYLGHFVISFQPVTQLFALLMMQGLLLVIKLNKPKYFPGFVAENTVLSNITETLITRAGQPDFIIWFGGANPDKRKIICDMELFSTEFVSYVTLALLFYKWYVYILNIGDTEIRSYFLHHFQ